MIDNQIADLREKPGINLEIFDKSSKNEDENINFSCPASPTI